MFYIAIRLLDFLLMPIVAVAALPMKLVRRIGVHKLPVVRKTLQTLGVFPIQNHYYEPMFDTRGLADLRQPRHLPGIDLNTNAQLALLASFNDIEGLANLQLTQGHGAPISSFYFENASFMSGDAELWYHVVRHFKPRRIIEIGSGHSTKIARLAIQRTTEYEPSYECHHTCIEPYEASWLEQLGVKVIRDKLEDVDQDIFSSLEKNDILFIDSSHIIRPQGDVLVEYLEILPKLATGVIVHIHDIFTPRDYLDEWVHKEILFWNEQYILEAYLSDSSKYEVLLAGNMLKNEFYDLLKSKCPYLTPAREPGSFYIRRI